MNTQQRESIAQAAKNEVPTANSNLLFFSKIKT
jgi:hypothetical protein